MLLEMEKNLAAADDFRLRTGVGGLSPLGTVRHIGVALRIDGLTVDQFEKRTRRRIPR